VKQEDNMHINVVTVQSGWILSKIAERIVAAGNKSEHTFTLSYRPNVNADVNFYVDVQNCYRHNTPGLDIGFFTHIHADDITTLNTTAFTLDYIFHMCTKYYNMFLYRFPEEKMTVLPAAEIHEGFDLKKPLIGIIQRGQYEGKGFDFMLSLDTNKLKNFRFRFVGTGWDEVVDKYTAASIDVENITNESYESYPQHYKDIDYLLIPSLWEGGPMSVIEACATGTPIIGANVGWIPDIGIDYMFEPGNADMLYIILDKICAPYISRRNKVIDITYDNYVEELLRVIESLKDE
jgi:glycosyltransferase involved in cell wall biosynthesis